MDQLADLVNNLNERIVILESAYETQPESNPENLIVCREPEAEQSPDRQPCVYSRETLMTYNIGVADNPACWESQLLAPLLPQAGATGEGKLALMELMSELDGRHASLSERLYISCEDAVQHCVSGGNPVVEATEASSGLGMLDCAMPTPTFADELYFDTRPRERDLRDSGNESMVSLANHIGGIGLILCRLGEIDKMTPEEYTQWEWENSDDAEDDTWIFDRSLMGDYNSQG